MTETPFQVEKVFWEKEGTFNPWYISENFKSIPLNQLKLNKKKKILVVENDTFSLGFLKSDVDYHHVVQGTHQGKSFMVSYCIMCNSGVVLNPVVEGEFLFFKSTGLYNGQLINKDTKTESIWHHLTGECLHGELKGKKLEVEYLKETTIKEELLNNPDLQILISKKHKTMKKMMSIGMGYFDKLTKVNKNLLPSFFANTIIEEDLTLPRMTNGLVVKIGDTARFYEAKKIKTGMTDTLNGEEIELFKSKVPYALTKNKKRPLQYYMKWYAFKVNFPDGELY